MELYHTKNGGLMNILMICIKIFFIRIIDVSLGTIRSIVTIKGNIFKASIIGFIEVLVWFIVAKEAITNKGGILIAIFYALGFSTGTFLGGILSKKFIKSKLGIQVVIDKDESIINKIRDNGYALSVVECMNDKYMLFIEVDSSKYDNILKLIKKLDENAFLTVNETRYVYNGYFS